MSAAIGTKNKMRTRVERREKGSDPVPPYVRLYMYMYMSYMYMHMYAPLERQAQTETIVNLHFRVFIPYSHPDTPWSSKITMPMGT